jgi:hypothetical protein
VPLPRRHPRSEPDYPQLKSALSRSLAEVGDLAALGDHDAARRVVSIARAIEAELRVGSRDPVC